MSVAEGAEQLILPAPIRPILTGELPIAEEPPTQRFDGWDAAFEELRIWKAQAWVEGDEDGAE